MKQQIISSANSILLLTLALTIIVGELTHVVPPNFKTAQHKISASEINLERPAKETLPISQIYGKRNIFGLEWDPLVADKFELTPSPELTELTLPDKPLPQITPPKENFIDPLNISVNGIITSSNEESNSCIISESSGEEKMYKVGDTVSDGTILGISLNSVALIRPNGQIETFKIGTAEFPGNNLNDSAITKVDENKYSIDPTLFTKQINSLGQLFEELGIIPAYKDDQSHGLMVTKITDDGVGKNLGLEENDIILSVHGTNLTSTKDRIDAYDKILKLNYNDSLQVEIERNANNIVLNYKLERFKPKIKTLAEALSGPNSKDTSSTGEKQNTIPSPEKNVSIFTKPAEDKERYSSNINTIRKRLLENATKQRISHLR